MNEQKVNSEIKGYYPDAPISLEGLFMMLFHPFGYLYLFLVWGLFGRIPLCLHAFILLRSCWTECTCKRPYMKIRGISVSDFVIGGAILVCAYFPWKVILT